MMKRTPLEWINDLLFVVLGNFCLALSTVYFVLPFKLLTGGLAGITNIVTKFVAIDPTLLIYILNFSLFTIGTIFLGRDFAIKTIISTFLYPLLISLLNLFPYQLDISPLLAIMYAGGLIGAGTGLVFRTGGSTGGMDIPPLLMNKYLHIDLSTGAMIVDGITVLCGIVAYGIELALLGLVAVFVASYMIDKMLVIGGEQTKVVYIISNKWETINTEIQRELDRGATLITSKGGYTMNERPIVFVVIRQRQYGLLKRVVQNIDPTAFVVISEATEISGEGFTYEK